jgi:outer membrane protein assembly factor BamB
MRGQPVVPRAAAGRRSRTHILRSTIVRAAMLVVATVATLIPTATAAPAGTVDWPHFRFDTRHTGFQPFETQIGLHNVSMLRLTWEDQLGNFVSSSPAIVDGVAYVASSDGRLWAVDADGCGQQICTEPLWTGVGIGQALDSPAVAGGMVYIGSQTSFSSNDGKLNAFRADGCGHPTCEPEWQGLAGKESILDSSPAVASGTVFVGSYDGALYAFDADGCGQRRCPALWKATTGGPIESSPTVVNGVVYIGSNDGFLYAFDADGCGQRRCHALWKGAARGPIFASSPAVTKGRVFVASAQRLAAFDANGCGHARCEPLWLGRHGEDFFGGSPAIHRGKIYIGLESSLGVFDANGCGDATCQPLWIDFAGGEQAIVASSPAIANGVVYVGRNTGEVLAFPLTGCGDPVCFNELWSGKPEGSSQVMDSSPAVVDGRVCIGGTNRLVPPEVSGRLYVFALP